MAYLATAQTELSWAGVGLRLTKRVYPLQYTELLPLRPTSTVKSLFSKDDSLKKKILFTDEVRLLHTIQS